MKNILHSLLIVSLFLGLPLQSNAVDHTLFDSVLNKYTDGGYFDYSSYVEDPESRQRLDRYRSQMSQVQLKELDGKEKLAYWLNLYNASTIHLIAKNYPLESIKDLGGWFGSPFDKKFIPTTKGELSLNTIEHDIIRPDFNEPRIHFALVCAARSCPPLRFEAYTAEKLDEQLENQARQFIASDKNRFVIQNDQLTLKLSSIFYWYGEDFGGESGLANYLKKYLDDRGKTLIGQGNYSISYLDYDWSLNQAPGPYQR
ncbi:MAG: DUF547 domain-containing protein [bacterium]